MTGKTIDIFDALATDKASDAASLFFEYMTATLDEVGWPVPAVPSELPGVWRAELDDLASIYSPPGVLLVAYRRKRPVGVVGMHARNSVTVEVKHLYVRPDERGGVGRLLMNTLHSKAKEGGFQRVVLDVLTSRQGVIDFYRRLGYVDIQPYTAEPVPVVFLGLKLGALDDSR